MRRDNARFPMQMTRETAPETADRHELHALLKEEEERHDLVESRKMLRRLTLAGPFVVGFVLLAVIAVLQGPEVSAAIVGQAILIFTVLGKFAILQGVLHPEAFTPWELATIVAYMDISIAVILVYNLPRLYRIPRLGPTLEDLAEHGLFLLEQHPWLRRITILGVVAFVMFPLTGTGAIGGSIFGRLLGLGPRRTMASIAVGACIGSFGMAAFGHTIAGVFTEEMRDSWEFKAVGVASLLVMVAIVWWRGRKVTQQLRARREARLAARNGVTTA
jgi:uncharacterized membrane protein